MPLIANTATTTLFNPPLGACDRPYLLLVVRSFIEARQQRQTIVKQETRANIFLFFIIIPCLVI